MLNRIIRYRGEAALFFTRFTNRLHPKQQLALGPMNAEAPQAPPDHTGFNRPSPPRTSSCSSVNEEIACNRAVFRKSRAPAQSQHKQLLPYRVFSLKGTIFSAMVIYHSVFIKQFKLFAVCERNRGQTESAGINRHRVGDERALHKRRSCSIMAPSHASVLREDAAKR